MFYDKIIFSGPGDFSFARLFSLFLQNLTKNVLNGNINMCLKYLYIILLTRREAAL